MSTSTVINPIGHAAVVALPEWEDIDGVMVGTIDMITPEGASFGLFTDSESEIRLAP